MQVNADETSTFGQLTEEGFNALINGGDKEDGTKAEHYDEGDIATYGNTKVHYKDTEDQTAVIARSSETKNVILDIANDGIKYDLVIKKAVTGTDKDVTKEFDLNIKLFDWDGNAVSGQYIMDKNGEESEISINQIGFNTKIKHDDIITIKNVTTGYSFEISEGDTNYTECYNIKTKSEVIKDTTKGLNATGKVEEDTTIIFINNKDKPDVSNPENSNIPDNNNTEKQKSSKNNNPEKKESLIPETGDDIITYMLGLVISIIGLCWSIVYITKDKIDKNNT